MCAQCRPCLPTLWGRVVPSSRTTLHPDSGPADTREAPRTRLHPLSCVGHQYPPVPPTRTQRDWRKGRIHEGRVRGASSVGGHAETQGVLVDDPGAGDGVRGYSQGEEGRGRTGVGSLRPFDRGRDGSSTTVGASGEVGVAASGSKGRVGGRSEGPRTSPGRRWTGTWCVETSSQPGSSTGLLRPRPDLRLRRSGSFSSDSVPVSTWTARTGWTGTGDGPRPTDGTDDNF